MTSCGLFSQGHGNTPVGSRTRQIVRWRNHVLLLSPNRDVCLAVAVEIARDDRTV